MLEIGQSLYHQQNENALEFDPVVEQEFYCTIFTPSIIIIIITSNLFTPYNSVKRRVPLFSSAST